MDDRFPYRSVDDVMALVKHCLGAQDVARIVVQPGFVTASRSREQSASLSPTPALPSDRLLDRLRTGGGGGGFRLGAVTEPDAGKALVVAMKAFHRARLHPTHLLGRTLDEVYTLFSLGKADQDQQHATSRFLFGVEVVTDPEVPESTVFLCGGPFVQGSIVDVCGALRIDYEE